MDEVFVIQKRVKNSAELVSKNRYNESTEVLAYLGAFAYESDASDMIDNCYKKFKDELYDQYQKMKMYNTPIYAPGGYHMNYQYQWTNSTNGVIIHGTGNGEIPSFEDFLKKNGFDDTVYEVVRLELKGWEDEDE